MNGGEVNWQISVINAMELAAVNTVRVRANKTIQDMENPVRILVPGVREVEYVSGVVVEVSAENLDNIGLGQFINSKLFNLRVLLPLLFNILL
jgi:hypothetical protein